ncbi:MAG: hypothetical protein IJN92_10930 [Lachnospiraceae bacterium]|nr:hypothetical protein [Lachnospiraceae bacterium]
MLVDYKQWAEQSEDREWDFSEFFAAPFIKDTNGRFISLSDITLRNAFFEKMFWLIRDCYPVEDSRAMAFFGRLYEKYIQDITEDAAEKGWKNDKSEGDKRAIEVLTNHGLSRDEAIRLTENWGQMKEKIRNEKKTFLKTTGFLITFGRKEQT